MDLRPWLLHVMPSAFKSATQRSRSEETTHKPEAPVRALFTNPKRQRGHRSQPETRSIEIRCWVFLSVSQKSWLPWQRRRLISRTFTPFVVPASAGTVPRADVHPLFPPEGGTTNETALSSRVSGLASGARAYHRW